MAMGGKHVNLDSKFQSKKCAEGYYGNDDWISRLPDEILVVILSLLPLNEAARTSVLSSRWINLWKHTSSLNFVAYSTLSKIARQNELCNVERHKYVEWVNSVLQSHKALTLKKFKICFDLEISAQHAITRWLEFAFARQVQWLELELLEYGNDRRGDPSKNYVFPEELLRQSSGGAPIVHQPSDNCIHHARTDFDFKSIKALSLKSVNVTGEAIEFFLHNCPLLEQLVVHRSDKISNLEVRGSSLTLKHLEIVVCYNLKSLKISAPNLTSLKVTELTGVVLENVPSLVELFAACDSDDNSVKDLVPALSCCFSQLEVLRLLLSGPKESFEACNFPELPKLKKLEIEYFAMGDQSLLGLTSLIRASPCLQELLIKVMRYEPPRTNREINNDTRFPHQHLKVVWFIGYCGCDSDVEFIRYISKNCVVLEKILIQTEGLSLAPTHTPKLDDKRTAISYAKQFLEAEIVPQHIKLVII